MHHIYSNIYLLTNGFNRLLSKRRFVYTFSSRRVIFGPATIVWTRIVNIKNQNEKKRTRKNRSVPWHLFFVIYLYINIYRHASKASRITHARTSYYNNIIFESVSLSLYYCTGVNAHGVVVNALSRRNDMRIKMD